MADSAPTRDWLVTFARKVAEERDYSTRHPGHAFTVMLKRDEAEGLLEQVRELVDDAAVDADLARRRGAADSSCMFPACADGHGTGRFCEGCGV